jgi:hypothetical protein
MRKRAAMAYRSTSCVVAWKDPGPESHGRMRPLSSCLARPVPWSRSQVEKS